jgi:hypothetical protein
VGRRRPQAVRSRTCKRRTSVTRCRSRDAGPDNSWIAFPAGCGITRTPALRRERGELDRGRVQSGAQRGLDALDRDGAEPRHSSARLELHRRLSRLWTGSCFCPGSARRGADPDSPRDRSSKLTARVSERYVVRPTAIATDLIVPVVRAAVCARRCTPVLSATPLLRPWPASRIRRQRR